MGAPAAMAAAMLDPKNFRRFIIVTSPCWHASVGRELGRTMFPWLSVPGLEEAIPRALGLCDFPLDPWLLCTTRFFYQAVAIQRQGNLAKGMGSRNA
jgi:hypothetical protein